MQLLVIFARRLACVALLALAATPVTLGLSVLTPTVAQAAVASSITVQGNRRIEAQTIKSYLTIKPGHAYGPQDINDSVKALYATGLFADVRIAPHGSTLVVAVVENPVVASVVFEGNKKIKSPALSQIVMLKPRGILTEARLQSDVDRIKEYYANSGHSLASVTPRVTQLEDNRAAVVFAIDEGERTGVGGITFVGNKAFSAARLRRIIVTRKHNWLSWLNKRDVYSEAKLHADEDALRQFYMAHGYADFQVLDAHADFDATKGRYYVTFTLDEGPKYKFGDMSIDSSIPDIKSSSLMKFVRTKSGRVFDANDVQSTVEDLTVELSRLGYVFAAVSPRGDRNYSNNTIAVTYAIDEGPRAYIERIEIHGNTKTRDYVIRREFDIAEGDAYNRVLIDKAERNLKALGFFKTVNITTHQGSAPDKVVVVVDVEEQSTGSFSIAGGVSSSQGLIAEVALTEKNFLGRGQNLRIAYGGGLSDQTFSVAFADPYFLGYHMSAGFNVFRNTSSTTSYQKYNSTTTGGGIQFGLPITDNFSVGLNYQITNKTISYGSSTGCTVATGPVAPCYFPAGTRLTSAAGYSLRYSTVDDYSQPHEGAYFKFDQAFAGIGGNARYVRTTVDARYYHPLGPKSDIIGQVRVAGGNITGLGMPVAISDNFFKGGETIRGFAPLGYGPRDQNTGTTDGGFGLGGKNFWSATAEVQFPLPGISPDFGLRGAVFADAGMLWGVDTASCGGACTGNTTLGDTTIRSSVGASILWASPIGDLRFDFADALTKASYDNTQFFRVGVGSSF